MSEPTSCHAESDDRQQASSNPALAHPGVHIHYEPDTIAQPSPEIILIGCGGIARHHLQAYRDAGLEVTGLVDVNADAAEQMRANYYPAARVFTDFRQCLLALDAPLIDIATHPAVRTEITRECLLAGRHVLSQKPFVLDLDVGQELVELADRQGVILAVNQNGRWAPHFSYLRAATAAGLLGQTFAVRMSCDWDHTWVKGTAFEHIRELILYDYAIHWFDMVRCLLPHSEALRVYASSGRTPHQEIMPNLLGQVLVEFDNAQASMTFDAMVKHAPEERTYVAGTAGVVVSSGSGNQDQHVTLTTDQGSYQPQLSGRWFPDGFRGTMCELISSIAEGRPCQIAAEDNLKSLALCFAAIQSARSGQPVRPGEVRKLPADAT
ncbi:Gfo/Idh/MocA family protein [Planctomycetaceae bacterium SH139]